MSTDVERLAVLIEANTKSYERAMQQLQSRTERAIRGATRSARSLDTQLKRMSVSAMRFATAFGIGFSAVQLPRVITSIVSEAAGLANTADRIGMTTDRLQELHHAAKLADVEVGQLNKSMEGFARRIGEAASGSGNLLKILQANNVELRTADGNMRPMNELLGDYAELIKNAGSEQERLFLATQAYGNAGAGMVNILQKGRAGLEANAQEARKLGLVLEEKLVRDAQRVNDQFGRFTGIVATEFKRAVLDVAGGFDAGNDALEEFGRNLGRLFRFIGENIHVVERLAAALLLAKVGGALGGIAGRRGRMIGGVAGGVAGLLSPELREMALASGMDLGEGGPTKITVTPPSFGTGNRTTRTRIPNQQTAAEADRRAQAIQKVVEALKLEYENLGRTNVEQRLYNELARAGVERNSEAGQAIEELVKKIDAKRQAMEAAEEAAKYFGDALYDSLDALIFRGEKAQDVLKNLVVQLGRAALQAALLGQGPLAGILGLAPTSPGGLGGVLGAMFGGFRAEGGAVERGRAYVVGERGRPELFVPGQSGTIMPEHKLAKMLGGQRPIQINAPVTIHTPNAESFMRSSGEVSRTIGRAVERAARFL